MGLVKLEQRLKNPDLGPYLSGIFPKDSVENAKFATNFFTLFGLGQITEGLRAFIDQAPKILLEQKLKELAELKNL